MAMSVSCSPNPLVSLSSAATRPTFSASCYLPIICSKRKKKASAKPKILSPSKPSNLKLTQHEDILLGIGGGASTLTALRPRLDEEDPLLQKRQQLELHLAHERLLQKLPEDPLATKQSLDSLSRYTFAPYESSDASISKLCAAADELEDDDDDDDEEEFEWVEINAEDDEDDGDDDDENDEEGKDRYVYWGGDLGPMTEEEEAKLLCEAEKELTQLEREKRNASKWVASCGHLAQDADDGEEEETEEGEEEELDGVVYIGRNEEEVNHSSDYSETDEVEEDTLFSEAEAELAQFEARSWKLNYAERSHAVDSLKEKPIYSSNKKKLQDSQTSLENEMAKTLDDEEDEAAFIARITKEIEAEERRGVKTQDGKGREKLQKRGIPAVMRSFDKTKIYVKSGNGGNGIVAFRREKYVPFGGPSGGSGGRGGNIYVEADPSINSLLSFRKSVHFRAGRGSHGLGKSQDGAAGVDCTIKVPLGTVIREAGDALSGSGKVLLELTRPEQRELLLLGGRGGRGNTSFKTGRNKTPQLAENGEEGPEMWLELELKLVADVGIIGVPNAGKSTLLSVISAAKPAIGAYPFTTLLPNLGVVPIGFESSMVVADLPGLLEGAHLGIGLGHEFLRHTERCRVLVHMVDGMSQQPEEEYEAVRLELQLFNPALSEKPCIVAFNKMDIPEAAERWKNFQAYLKEKGIEPICISAVTKMGTTEVINKAYSLLQSLPRSPYENDTGEESQIAGEELAVGEIIRRQRSASIEEFEIFGDTESKTWQVQGVGLERFTQMTNWEYFEALRRFQHVLNVSGVNKALRQRGVCEGDTVIVGEMEFVWHDSEDVRATEWKRGFRGSRIWPH